MIQKIGNPKTENAGLGRDSRVASATIQEILPLSGICDAERRDGHKSPKIALLAAMMVAIMMGMMMPNSVWAQPGQYPVNFINVPITKQTEYYALYQDMLPYSTIPNLQWTPPCYNNDDGSVCNGWNPWTYETAIIEHPNFPGCPVLVTYKIRMCSTNVKIRQIYIDNIALKTPNANACLSLRNYLGWNGEEISNADINNNQFEHDLYALVAKHNFMKLAEMFEPEDLLCDDYDHSRISYYAGSCRGVCRAHFLLPEGVNVTIRSPRYCSAELCCRVDNLFCMDADGNLVHREEKTTIENAEECNTYPETDQQCADYFRRYPNYYPYITDAWVTRCNINSCEATFLNLGD